MVYETRKILGDESILVNPTCVRIPVANCHSEVITVETERPVSPEEARELFSNFPGITVVDDLNEKQYPMPSTCARQRRSLHWPNPQRHLEPERLELLVRKRQPAKRCGNQRRTDRRTSFQTVVLIAQTSYFPTPGNRSRHVEHYHRIVFIVGGLSGSWLYEVSTAHRPRRFGGALIVWGSYSSVRANNAQ